MDSYEEISPARRGRSRRNQLIIIAVFLLGGAAFVLWALASRGAPQPEVGAGDGAQDYAVYCGGCHGPAGAGVPGVGPAVDASGETWRRTDGELGRLILDGNQKMPGYRRTLSEAQAQAVLRYIQAWWTEEQLAQQRELSAQDPWPAVSP
jgi:mono/diheme cytochrome c family protein